MKTILKPCIVIALITCALWSCIKDDSIDVINRHSGEPPDTTHQIPKVMLTLHITDESDQLIEGAQASLYLSPQAYAGDSSLASGPILTDTSGDASFRGLSPQIYYFWVKHEKKYNSFTTIELDSIIDTTKVKVVNVKIKPLTSKELILATDSAKAWVVTTIVTPYITIPNPLIDLPVIILWFKSNGTYSNPSSGGSFISLGSGFWSLASDASSLHVVQFNGSGALDIPLTQLNKYAMIASMNYGGVTADITFEPYSGK